MAHLLVKNGIVKLEGRAFPCAIGRAGLTADKREGDLMTPLGTFPLRTVYYRADRLEMPQTRLPVVALSPDDGWCDDPADACYNQHVRLPYAGRHEQLWRADHLYDLILVIGYNDAPVVPGRGSAIFMHIRRPDGVGTEGCVALERADLLEVLAQLGPDSTIEIR